MALGRSTWPPALSSLRLWQRLASLRALLAYQHALPGKKLLFMGGEFGQEREWNHDRSLDWHLLEDPAHRALYIFNHFEYDSDTLKQEYDRDVANGTPINVPPGQHSLTVQAKGHKPLTKIVEVEAGKPRVERIDLDGDNTTKRIGVVRVIMSNPVDGAQYFINGRKIDESAALSDQGVEVASGKVIVVVKKEGFGQITRELQVAPGATETVTLELRNVGKIYFASEPRGAYVMLDRALIGQTPLTRENVQAGPHTYELSIQGFEPVGDTVNVVAGDTVNVSHIMRPPQPKPIDQIALQRSLSSFSAIVHDAGHFTGDIAAGYPYFANLRLTVGALEESNASPVTAMTEMLSATRMFEAFQRAIQTFHEADRRVATTTPAT